MRRKELVSLTTAKLKHDEVKKYIAIPKCTFHVTDETGHKQSFAAKGSSKTIYYNEYEIDKILDAFIDVVLDSIKRGEEIYVRDFGTFDFDYRPPKIVKDINTREPMLVDARYVLKFKPGNRMKSQVKLYNLWLKEQSELEAVEGETEDNADDDIVKDLTGGEDSIPSAEDGD